MKSLARKVVVLLGVSVFLTTTQSVFAAPENAVRKVLAEDEKVQVFELYQKPGQVNTPSTTGTRVIRALSGGTLLRTYADGRTERSDWGTGEVQIQGPGPQYTVTNVGDTEVVLYVVRLK